MASRLLTSCVEEKKCDLNDKRILNFTRLHIKQSEHTWGMHRINDYVNWTNEKFEKIVNMSQFSFSVYDFENA